MGCFMPEATVMEQVFLLVVQFISLHFKLEQDVEIRQLEGENDLPAGSVICVKWIKLAYKRAPDQTCGHIIFTFSKPEATNKVLMNGLIICQKHVYAEKCKNKSQLAV